MNASGRDLGWAGFCLLAVLWLAASGCETYGGPPEKNLALVTIANRPMADVQAAVAKVFIAHGFAASGTNGDDTFNFTRKGSHTEHLFYGSYVFGDTVTVKVTVTTRRLPDGSIGASCTAWMDAGEDDPVFDGDHQVSPLRKGPYEALLKEVKKQLGE